MTFPTKPLLLLGLAGAAGLFALLATSQTPPPKPAPATTGAPSIPAATAPTSAKEQVLTEAEVNSRIAQVLAQHTDRIPFQGVQVHLRTDGKVDAQGTMQMAGRETEVQATFRITAQQGIADVEIESVRAGALPLPAFLTNQLAERAASALGLSNFRKIQLPPGIEAVTVREGTLILTQR